MADDHKDMDIISFFLVLGVFILFFVMMWIFFSDQISSGVRWIRVAQIHLINLFTDDLRVIQQQLMQAQPSQLSLGILIQTSEYVTSYTRYPIAGALGLMAVYALFLKKGSGYNRKMSLERLIEEHSKGFPVISPITRINPTSLPQRVLGNPVPAKMPMFSEALAPEEWIAFHAVPTLSKKDVDLMAAKRAFAKQLVARWNGPEALPTHLQALFVAFSMKANGMRSESDAFLAELSTCWDPKKGLKLTKELKKKVRDGVRDPRLGMITAKICRQHAFVTTGMLRALDVARSQGGVLAPAQFLWLRAVDRRIWYPLNNLGRSACHVEGAGAMSHYRAELAADKPIPTPQVDTAVDGLQAYLEEFEPQIPPLDYSNKKVA